LLVSGLLLQQFYYLYSLEGLVIGLAIAVLRRESRVKQRYE